VQADAIDIAKTLCSCETLNLILYNRKEAIASRPAATALTLMMFAAAAPVKGVGVELEVVVLLPVLLLPPLLLLLFVELEVGRKLAQVRRVVL